jgi:hypothetical protein
LRVEALLKTGILWSGGLVITGALLASGCGGSLGGADNRVAQSPANAEQSIVRPAMRPAPGDGGSDDPPVPPSDPPDPPDCPQRATGSLSVSSAEIALSQRVSLSWSVVLPARCTLGQITVAGQEVGVNGTIALSPWFPQTYALVYSGRTLALASVTKVSLPSVVRIKGNTADWRGLLIHALGKDKRTDPDRTVILAHDVDMDLTGFNEIFISNGITLTSEARPLGNAPPNTLGPGLPNDRPVARDPRNPGPRLYTRTRGKSPLFTLRCDDMVCSSATT